MHGEREMIENVVQMILRERLPAAFRRYLLLRADDPNAPWEELAAMAGLTEEQIEGIGARLETDRYDLVLKEYDTVAGLYGVLDGSPTYLWDGRIVRNPKEIPFLTGGDMAPPTTQNTPPGQ